MTMAVAIVLLIALLLELVGLARVSVLGVDLGVRHLFKSSQTKYAASLTRDVVPVVDHIVRLLTSVEMHSFT
jgi:hypothetical protein